MIFSVEKASVLVVTGPPGAGKTTVAAVLAKTAPRRSAHLHADDFWHHLVVGYVEPWLPEAHEQNESVMRAVFASVFSLWRDAYDVVLDGIVGPWFLDVLLAAAPDDMPIDYVILRPSLDVATQRVASREGHGMRDLEATAHMHADFVAIDEAYSGHVIDTSLMSVEETVSAVRELSQHGQLRLRG